MIANNGAHWLIANWLLLIIIIFLVSGILELILSSLIKWNTKKYAEYRKSLMFIDGIEFIIFGIIILVISGATGAFAINYKLSSLLENQVLLDIDIIILISALVIGITNLLIHS